VNKRCTSERLSSLLAFVLSCIFYTAAGALVVFLAQRTDVEQQPAMGPPAVNLSFAQIELQAAVSSPAEPVPPAPPLPPPEPADVALEEIQKEPEPQPEPEAVRPEEMRMEPEPVPAQAQVLQEASAPATPVESAEPLAGTVAEVDWRGMAVAKVRAMVEREKYYPAAARNAGYTGWFRVRIHLAMDGTVSGYEVEERHGQPLLGRAVETTLGKIQGRKIGIELPQPLDVPLTIEFELN
jgi:protein TonB